MPAIRNIVAATLLATGLISSASATPFARRPRTSSKGNPEPAQKHIDFYPVNPNSFGDYEHRADVAGASTGDFVYKGLGGLMHMVNREYGLRDSESFYWGPAGNPVANLTAYVGGKNVKVLSLERFENVLENAKCTHTSVQFTFNKEIQFDTVQKEWGWINDAEDNYLVLVTENERCNMPDGDPSQRQPWHITKAVFDDDKNIVTLKATPKTWEDAFSNWHLRVSSKGLLPRDHRTRRSLHKRWEENYSLSLAANFSTEPLEFDGSMASIACSPCYTSGSLDFDVDVNYEFPFSITGSVTMTPDNIAAVFTAAVSASEEFTSPQGVRKTIWEVHPDGISIPGILTIGPGFIIDLVAQLDATTATIDLLTTGVQMSIPADAIAVLDFDDSSANKWYDWTPVFVPQMPSPDFNAAITMSASAGIEWRLEFDLQVLTWGLSAGLALEAPQFTISLTGTDEMSSGGACDDPDAQYGVDLDVSLGVELDIFAGFGAATDLPNAQPLLSTAWDLFSTCLVVASGAPGPLPSPSAKISSIAVGSAYAPSYRSAVPSQTSAAPSGRYSSSAVVVVSSVHRVSSSAAAISYHVSSVSAPASSYYASPSGGSSAAPRSSSTQHSVPVAISSYQTPMSSAQAPASSYYVAPSGQSSAAHESYSAPEVYSASKAGSSVVVYASVVVSASGAQSSG